ncbi:MAG: hypothetical protein FWD68_03815 [Alphaproteobacteria bacterium]|nr:hypothetical protein [Alphaproteobacteria bacterium]
MSDADLAVDRGFGRVSVLGVSVRGARVGVRVAAAATVSGSGLRASPAAESGRERDVALFGAGALKVAGEGEVARLPEREAAVLVPAVVVLALAGGRTVSEARLAAAPGATGRAAAAWALSSSAAVEARTRASAAAAARAGFATDGASSAGTSLRWGGKAVWAPDVVGQRCSPAV